MMEKFDKDLLDLDIENVVEIANVADCQTENLDLGEFLIWRKSWKQLSQVGESGIEGFYTDTFPRCVS